MKTALKSYKAFTGYFYRIMTFVLIPLIVLVVNVALSLFLEVKTDYFLYECYLIILIVEDYWVFGGICIKNPQKLEYIKSSKRGLQIMQNAIIADLVLKLVRLVLLSVFYMISWIMLFKATMDATLLCHTIRCTLMGYIVSVAALNMTRYASVFYIHYFVALVVGMFAVIAMAFVSKRSYDFSIILQIGIIIGEIILAAGVCIATACHITKRVKGSYYDEKDSK